MNKTGIDFSKHEFTVQDLGPIMVYKLKKPDTIIHNLTFIVGLGVTTVTGDFGNWVFCREFHPVKNDYISRGYADEKLTILSVQKPYVFDTDTVLKEIDELVEDWEYKFGREPNEEDLEWIEALRENAHDELDYLYVAHREKIDDIEHEDVPDGEARHRWLEVVYDAFNEMCDRLKQENGNS